MQNQMEKKMDNAVETTVVSSTELTIARTIIPKLMRFAHQSRP